MRMIYHGYADAHTFFTGHDWLRFSQFAVNNTSAISSRFALSRIRLFFMYIKKSNHTKSSCIFSIMVMRMGMQIHKKHVG